MFATLVVAALSAATVFALQHRENRSRHTATLLAQAGEIKAELNSLEWQAIGRGAVPRALAAEWRDETARMDASLAGLASADPASWRRAAPAWTRYREAADSELALLADGKRAAAHELDEQTVDPSYENLHHLLEQLQTDAGARAAAAATRSRVGIVAALLLTALAVFFLLRRFRLERIRERAAELELDRLRTLAEAPFEGVAVIAGGRVAAANPTFSQLVGVDAAGLEGRPIEEILPAWATRDLIDAGLRDIAFSRPDGSKVELEIQARAAGDGTIVVAAQDVGERRRLEARARQAERLESLGVLAGGIAHDFNNLLTGVLGHASLALDETGEDVTRRRLSVIAESAERAAELARQMLTYAGDTVGVFERVDLAELVRELAPELATPADTAKLVLDAAASTIVTADRAHVASVVSELVENAAEAGATAVHVSVGTFLPSRGYLAQTSLGGGLRPEEHAYLEVSDDGEGMDEATRERIFDPFFTTRFPGRGLGLATVLGIVRGHGGGIHVTSRDGGPTRVRVLLPLGTRELESARRRGPESRAARDQPLGCR